MKWRLIITIAAVVVLGLNLALGKVTHGAANWIVIGPVSIQPSEFVKIAYIFVGASTLDSLLTKKEPYRIYYIYCDMYRCFIYNE